MQHSWSSSRTSTTVSVALHFKPVKYYQASMMGEKVFSCLAWDHTTINSIPVSSWTMYEKGKRGGMNDEADTVVLGVSKNGHCLPPQVIYTEKTNRSYQKLLSGTDGLEYYHTCAVHHTQNMFITLAKCILYLEQRLPKFI